MHECPDCGQACACDGEDAWFDDLQTFLNCSHDCEQYDDDDIDEYIPADEREQDLSLLVTRVAEQRDGAVQPQHSGLFEEQDEVYDCGNCGVPRFVHNGILEKCPMCGDDEFDMVQDDNVP